MLGWYATLKRETFTEIGETAKDGNEDSTRAKRDDTRGETEGLEYTNTGAEKRDGRT